MSHGKQQQHTERTHVTQETTTTHREDMCHRGNNNNTQRGHMSHGKQQQHTERTDLTGETTTQRGQVSHGKQQQHTQRTGLTWETTTTHTEDRPHRGNNNNTQRGQISSEKQQQHTHREDISHWGNNNNTQRGQVSLGKQQQYTERMYHASHEKQQQHRETAHILRLTQETTTIDGDAMSHRTTTTRRDNSHRGCDCGGGYYSHRGCDWSRGGRGSLVDALVEQSVATLDLRLIQLLHSQQLAVALLQRCDRLPVPPLELLHLLLQHTTHA